MTTLDVHVVYDNDGLILAIAHAAGITTPDGMLLRQTPVVREGQHTVRLTLDDDYASLGAVAIVRRCVMDLSSDVPKLRARSD